MLSNRRNTISFLPTVTLLACVLIISVATTTTLSTSIAEPHASKRLQEELGRLFNKYELVRLSPPEVARRVRDSGHLSITTASNRLDIDLTPRDLRAPHYRADEAAANGVRRNAKTRPVNTYRGTVRGEVSARARFTVNDSTIEGAILLHGEIYYLESASRYSSSAGPEDFIFYKASDLTQNSVEGCGVTLDEKIETTAKRMLPQAQASASGLRVLEIATEADYEYVTALGGVESANAEILSILNQVEGVYEKELGITFQVVYQNAWGAIDDPYTTTDNANQLLDEFRKYWEANFSGIRRDIAHIWTGKNTTGVFGVAILNAVCNRPSLAYGLTRRITTTPQKFLTTAHEIGHNFGATHVDETHGCVGTIMNILMDRTLTFCQYSRDQITQHVDQAGACLDPLVGFAIAGKVTDVSGNPESGVMLTLGGSQVGVTETDEQGNYSFRDLPAGRDYSVTASKQNFSFSPAQSSLQNLSADRLVHFTLTASPRGPTLVTENGSATVLALDSVLFTTNPFGVFSNSHFNLDQRTRIILFAYNLSADTPLSSVTVYAQDAQQRVFPLTVESIRSVPGHDWLTQINVKLPDELRSGGAMSLSLSVAGVPSNKVILNIKAQ